MSHKRERKNGNNPANACHCCQLESFISIVNLILQTYIDTMSNLLKLFRLMIYEKKVFEKEDCRSIFTQFYIIVITVAIAMFHFSFGRIKKTQIFCVIVYASLFFSYFNVLLMIHAFNRDKNELKLQWNIKERKAIMGNQQDFKCTSH